MAAANKKRSSNWSQSDTELLSSLIMQHGSRGILNKQTNATTNDRKKTEWSIICERFNSNPSIVSQRDIAALQARYKKIMHALRINAKFTRESAMKTGGGPADRPTDLKINITGDLLQLQQLHGHLITGLKAFDSDCAEVNEREANIEHALDIPQIETTDVEFLLEDDYEIATRNVSPQSPTDLTVASTTTASTPIIFTTSTSAHDVQTTASITPLEQQFFPTTIQRRRSRPSANISFSRAADYDESRLQLLTEERPRLAELHAARLQAIRDESAARIQLIQLEKNHKRALHAKQLEFWNLAMEQVRGNGRRVDPQVQSSENSNYGRDLNALSVCGIVTAVQEVMAIDPPPQNSTSFLP